jgi:flagellar assembly protein FliH
MNSSSSAPTRTAILRGSVATRVTPARIDADLRTSPYITSGFADARLVDPNLAKAFEDAVAAAGARARDEGFARGYAEGTEAAGRESAAVLDRELALVRENDEARNAAVGRALSVLEEAAQAFVSRQVVALHEFDEFLLGAALDLATTLLGRELEAADAPVRDAVRRALSVLPADLRVTVVVHPLDLAALGDLDAVAGGRSVRIISDPGVEPGSCVADAGATHVEASLAAALDRVRQVIES